MRYGRLQCSSHLFSLQALHASLLFFSPFRPGLPTPGSWITHMSVCLNFSGYGISTVCASTTPFGLALAPGLPRADEPAPGNLRFSAITILTQFSLLIPAFSLPYSPPLLPLRLHPVCDAPLPLTLTRESQASVTCLAPLNFPRKITRPVSYYALFERVAASKPTSWLFSQSHIVFHLACIGDLSCGSGLFPF